LAAERIMAWKISSIGERSREIWLFLGEGAAENVKTREARYQKPMI
jgi:hypothetical protein